MMISNLLSSPSERSFGFKIECQQTTASRWSKRDGTQELGACVFVLLPFGFDSTTTWGITFLFLYDLQMAVVGLNGSAKAVYKTLGGNLSNRSKELIGEGEGIVTYIIFSTTQVNDGKINI